MKNTRDEYATENMVDNTVEDLVIPEGIRSLEEIDADLEEEAKRRGE